MLCPKMDEPIKPIRETYEYMDDLIADEYNYNGFLEAYNTWLSSSLEIIGEHNWKDLQEVVEGVDYEKKLQFLSHDGKSWVLNYFFSEQELAYVERPYRPVAIPKKEKDCPNCTNGLENRGNGDVRDCSHCNGSGKMLNNDLNVQVSDTTDDDSSKSAD
jgi:hypothetical protein